MTAILENISPFLSALRCLFLVCRHHHVDVTPEQLLGAREADIVGSVLRLMQETGLKGAVLVNRKWKDLAGLGSAYPVMVEKKSGHWLIVSKVDFSSDGVPQATVMDPQFEQSGVIVLTRKQFEADWSGNLLLCRRDREAAEAQQPFGLTWFLPEIFKQGKLLRNVAIATVLSSILSLALPLFFQIMIDKVIPYQSHQTLMTLTVILVLILLFELLFRYVREYLMLVATNKIDARLISRTFHHLLHLPMPFFENNPTGVLIRHMQQTEAVRNFLTGSLFHALLDVATLPLLLFGLAMYSGLLTFVVLMFTVAIATVIAVMLPTFRRHLENLYNAEGLRQADLVETIHGMRAVKSMALEPLRKAAWDRMVAVSILRRGKLGGFGIRASAITGGLQSGMQISIIVVGAMLVFDNTLSMGALVAFNMLSGRVTGPLLQIVAMINEYQQTTLAVRMLGTVMNHPPERDPNQQGMRTAITGQLVFNNVTFSYNKSALPALKRVSFKVEEGQMIGVVGRSGSGKTTITRLIQGIHSAQEGLIFLNGHDIRHFDLAHLRRSIGVVLQDNILFRGTIRENIAAARPEATLIEVIDAARMAGADEFIDRLPMSYETYVEENASNFSGGQKQRIAIARALLLSPRLLIFDEATSALDPESEGIIRKSLNTISRGRTMLIVSHRLSSLVSTDSILVLEQGEVVDFAPHAVLLERCDIYRHLWNQQMQYSDVEVDA
ncbi:MAG: peptidase domain-containing ABC transporter [Magnetococcales bacterium]|nr:peptidase domain-containing ABC transporter [Magnetococcales bacterium]MBF0439186.1 peptidase domain-containing ABC transporter [Magnetococcales bacterium]